MGDSSGKVAGGRKASKRAEKKLLENRLKSAKVLLVFALVILIYTCIKWTDVSLEYLANGVQAEANIFMVILVVPFGVCWFLLAMVCFIVGVALLGTYKLWSKMSNGLCAVAAASLVLLIVDMIELFYILAVTK